jgi:hypothetical protein
MTSGCRAVLVASNSHPLSAPNAFVHMPTYIEVAKQFGDLIAEQDYAGARALLTGDARVANTPDQLREAVEGMTSYAPGPIRKVLVMEEFILQEWPEKQDGDVAVAYVALNGDSFCEAVSVTIVQMGSDYRIRRLEWGRP